MNAAFAARAALCVGAMAALPASFAGPPGAPGTAAPRLEFLDVDDGISCRYFDVALRLPWPGGKPGWIDADGRPDGEHAIATDEILATDTSTLRRLDITALVRTWWAGGGNEGLLLRATGAPLMFHSREEPDAALRPQLRLQWADGQLRFVEPAADAGLDCATFRGTGQRPTLWPKPYAALRFELSRQRDVRPAPPQRAELLLVRTPASVRAAGTLSVFALRVPQREPRAAPADGIAAAHPGDRGIERHPDVLWADGFDGGRPGRHWKTGMPATPRVVDLPQPGQPTPLDGPALEVTIRSGQALGLDWRLPLGALQPQEPESLHLRYYLWLDPSWLKAADGGKLPGLAGTYGQAGWGGRAWDGLLGWSVRGHYGTPMPPSHPRHGWIVLGSYAYHAGSGAAFGEALVWDGSDFAGVVRTGRWICVEQQIRLNTPGRNDGELRAWIDGRLAFERRDLRLRDQPGLRIQEVWMNVFHGGTAVAPADMRAWIDRIVVARRYIGPVRE